jgi:hypothetical protein
MKYGDYLKIKYENRNCKKSNTNDAENKLFYEYKELYYLIEFDEKKKYSATVYEIPEITTSGNLDISSCEDSLNPLLTSIYLKIK